MLPTDVPPYFWTIRAIRSCSRLWTWCQQALQRAEDQRRVRSTEAERIGHRSADRHFLGDERGEIEVGALRIDVDEVRRRRRDLVANGEHGEHSLDASGCAEQMTGHRFGRRDRKAGRVVAKRTPD